ncbi:hypothetical protein [Lysobacter solisilvae (ex Woo and Kim 2020)]|uniref:Glycine zipper family protein n=1 Tax=Agrilutibacter terrestris TaxID=2865112 RepID=A0A7H0G1T6_9GAMM|nr:hypothetical protein [Lysobacter terrestris]QNP42252.1 hypothetical protein H8B22_11895 [Lysobacter terrestris]
MDKDQANAASDALMAPTKAAQTRQTERVLANPAKPTWRVIGFGLIGGGVGTAIGAGSGHGVLYGSVGFAIGVALGTAAARRQP